MEGAAAGVGRDGVPGVDLTVGDDEPELAVFHGASGVTQGGFGAGIGVAVVVAEDLQGLAAGFAMSAEQGYRVDLEGAVRMGAGIAGGDGGFDVAGGAEQEAATFVRSGLGCLGDKGFCDPA